MLSGVGQPMFYSFVLDKPSGYKVFCEPETIHFKKLNKSVLNTVTFHLEDDNNEEVNFNGETFTFTLQMIEILTNMFIYNYLSIYFCVTYTYLYMIYTSDNKSKYLQLYQFLYLCIHTFM